MLGARRGALDRSGRGLEDAGDHDARLPALDIRLELDALEERGMDGARHRPIDPPVCRALTGFFAVQDGSECVSLLTVRSLVDDSLTFAVALIDRPRPGIEEGGAKTIERDVSEVAP